MANCWWHPVSDKVLGEWQEDQQMVPIAVLLEEPFPEIAKRSVSSSPHLSCALSWVYLWCCAWDFSCHSLAWRTLCRVDSER